MSIFIKKRKIAALKPTEAFSPINEMKKTDAPSLIPRSPIVTGGITDFAKKIKIPAQM